MSNKGFMLTVVAVLILGGMVGGAFVAGLVVGGGSDEEEAPNVLTLPPPEGSGNAPTTGAPSGDIQSLGQIIQRVQSGEMTQEEVAQLRQMFQGGGFGGPGGRLGAGLAGGGVLSGTVESVEDGKITINTPQGPLEASIGPETVIQRTEVSTLSRRRAERRGSGSGRGPAQRDGRHRRRVDFRRPGRGRRIRGIWGQRHPDSGAGSRAVEVPPSPYTISF